MINPELFDVIELLIDLPKDNLYAGARGAIVKSARLGFKSQANSESPLKWTKDLSYSQDLRKFHNISKRL